MAKRRIGQREFDKLAGLVERTRTAGVDEAAGAVVAGSDVQRVLRPYAQCRLRSKEPYGLGQSLMAEFEPAGSAVVVALRLTARGLRLTTWGVTVKHVFRGRAYGLDIRVEREDGGTLSVYGSEVYADDYTLLARGSVEEMVRRYDVSGGLRRWLERQADTASSVQPVCNQRAVFPVPPFVPR